MSWTDFVFLANVLCQMTLLAGAVWCIAFPSKRIYPMLRKGFVYYVMWAMFWLVFISNFSFVLLHWNTGPWTNPIRFVLGAPLTILGGGLVAWGMHCLGVRNTSALPDGFVHGGPYAFTRNPQYLGDILLFAGVTIAANSEQVLVTHMLTSLVFLVAPLAEEPWLEEQYGDDYVDYSGRVPRFL